MSNPGSLLFPTNNLSFTNLNFISGAASAIAGTSTTLYIPSTTTNIVGQYMAAPATPYCLIANVACNMGDYNAATNTVSFGIGFYDGTKLVSLLAQWSSTVTMGLQVYESADVTHLTTSVFGSTAAAGQPTGTLQWFQIQDDGTNIKFLISTDAAGLEDSTHWVQVYTQARAAYLSAPTNIFWGGCNQSSGSKMYLTLNSWQTVSL